MVAFTNFYENLAEARMRLCRTMVMYDGTPYLVLCISDHKNDGVFRIYLDPVDPTGKKKRSGAENFSQDSAELPPYLDKFIEENKDSGVLRKKMNSPLFNKFRPFPLGMCNSGNACFYLERQPVRQREQGLTRNMIYENRVSLTKAEKKSSGLMYVDLWGEPMRNTILGKYPSAEEVLKNLKDPDIENEAVAFDRYFALIRGPMDMIFLAYKEFVIGVLPAADFSEVRLSRKLPQYKEVTEELKLFGRVVKQ